jgi:hypothetical protein
MQKPTMYQMPSQCTLLAPHKANECMAFNSSMRADEIQPLQLIEGNTLQHWATPAPLTKSTVLGFR